MGVSKVQDFGNLNFSPMKADCVRLILFQGCATGLQCTYGLYNSGSAHVELWCIGHDVYSLEGAITLTASLLDHHMCLNVPCFHQIPS